MNCKKCGNPITNFDKVCPSCGEVNEYYNDESQTVSLNQEQDTNEQVLEVPSDVSQTTVSNEAINYETQPASQEIIQPESVSVVQDVTLPQEVVTDAPIIENYDVAMQDMTNQESNTIEQDSVMPQEVISDAPVEIYDQTEEQSETSEPVTEVTQQETVPNELPMYIDEQPKEKNNKLFIILLIVLGVIIIGIGIFITVKLLGNSGSDNTNTKNTTKEETTNTENNNTEIETTEEQIEIDGYTFNIPSKFSVGSDQDNNVIIGTNDFYFSISRVVTGDKYEDIKTQLPNIATTLINEYENANAGITYVDSGEYTYSNKKFLIVSFSNGEQYLERVITELQDGSLFCTYVYYYSKDTAKIGYEYLTKFVNSGLSKTGSSFSSGTDNKRKYNEVGPVNPKIKFE